jgi:hypothetical protein
MAANGPDSAGGCVISTENTELSTETAMKALAQLFAQSSTGNSASSREGVNPREVLLGLSTFFKAIANASEPNETPDIELGLCNRESGISVSFVVIYLVCAQPLFASVIPRNPQPPSTSATADTSLIHTTSFETSIPSASETTAPLNAEHTSGSNVAWNPRQFLEKKGYTDLELDALQRRGKLINFLN